jgi:hypothetical protein
VCKGHQVPADDGSQADALLNAFARWSAEMRVRAETTGRSRQRWLHQQASESATFAGTLLDLAERRSQVSVLSPGRRFSGRLVGVGANLCVLEEPTRVTVVTLSQVIAVQPHLDAPIRGLSVATGNRPVALEMTFSQALAAMASDLAPIRLALSGTETLVGDLVAAGEDVVTLRVRGNPPRSTFIPIAGVEAFSPQ